VTKGTLLLELEHADREAAIESARMRAMAAHARVATASANLAETRLQAKRQRTLAEQGVSPSATAEDLEARAASLQEAVRAAEAEVKAADAEVSALRVDLQYMRVLAPIDGTVLNKPPEVGELVGTDIGGGRDKVIVLADFSTLMVETDIPEGRLHMVKLGSPAEISLDAFPGRRYRGEAVEVSPRVSRAKATVMVKVKFVDEAKDVLPDMSARVSFLTEAIDPEALKAKPKTVVPASAIVERKGAKVVFVLEGEAVRMRAVTVGEKIGGGYELLSGPEPGARLIASPPADLTDGQQVKEKS
jgi:RND family efflux transporter MFP subunit